MTAGARVKDASGNIIFDLIDRLPRVLGYTTMAANSSGSVTDNGFLTGTPFAICIRTNGSGTVFNGTTVAVSITFSGNVMSYSTTQLVADFLIIYMVY